MRDTQRQEMIAENIREHLRIGPDRAIQAAFQIYAELESLLAPQTMVTLSNESLAHLALSIYLLVPCSDCPKERFDALTRALSIQSVVLRKREKLPDNVVRLFDL